MADSALKHEYHPPLHLNCEDPEREVHDDAAVKISPECKIEARLAGAIPA